MSEDDKDVQNFVGSSGPETPDRMAEETEEAAQGVHTDLDQLRDTGSSTDHIFEFDENQLQGIENRSIDIPLPPSTEEVLTRLTDAPRMVVVSDKTNAEVDQIKSWLNRHLSKLERRPALKDLIPFESDTVAEKVLVEDLLAVFQPKQLDPIENGIRHLAVVTMNSRDLAISPVEMPELLSALTQSEMSVLVLLGEGKQLEQDVSGIDHWQPDLEPLWWHNYFAQVSAHVHEPDQLWLDQTLAEVRSELDIVHDYLSRDDGRRNLRDILLNQAPDLLEQEPAAAARLVLDALAQKEPYLAHLKDLIKEVFEGQGTVSLPAGRKIPSMAEISRSRQTMEPHATILFTLWASIKGTAGQGTNQDWFYGTVIYLLELIAEAEQKELDAIKADETLSKKQMRKERDRQSTPATDFLKGSKDRVWELFGYLEIESFRDKDGIPRLRFTDSRMVSLLGDYFDGSGRGYRSIRGALLMDKSVTLLHENENVNRVAQFLMIQNYRLLGSLTRSEVRERIVSDLLDCVKDDNTKELTRGPQRIADFIIYWFNISLDSHGDAEKLQEEMQGLTTDVLKALASDPDDRIRVFGFRKFFQRITFQRDNLLDVAKVFKHVAYGNKWELQWILLTFVEAEQKKRFKGRLQFRLFQFLRDSLEIPRPIDVARPTAHDQTRWFIAQLILRVLPGMVHRLQFEDYQPQDDTDTYSDRALAQVLKAEQGIEDFATVLLSPNVGAELSRLSLDWMKLLEARDRKGRAERGSPEHAHLSRVLERWKPWFSDVEKLRIETVFISLATTMPLKIKDGETKSAEERSDALNHQYALLQHQLENFIEKPTWQDLIAMNEEDREEALLMLRCFPVWVLSELFLMLKGSGREALAKRLCAAIGDTLVRKEAHALTKEMRKLQNMFIKAFAIALRQDLDKKIFTHDEWQVRYDFLNKKRSNVTAFSFE